MLKAVKVDNKNAMLKADMVDNNNNNCFNFSLDLVIEVLYLFDKGKGKQLSSCPCMILKKNH